MNIVSWIQMRFQSAIQGLSSMKSIPYMADTLPTGLVQTKKADETLDRQTKKIRGRKGYAHPLHIPFLCAP